RKQRKIGVGDGSGLDCLDRHENSDSGFQERHGETERPARNVHKKKRSVSAIAFQYSSHSRSFLWHRRAGYDRSYPIISTLGGANDPRRNEDLVDFRKLKYFVAVSEQKSFTKAAEILRIAQPALGLQIRQLEQQLKVQLLVRHSRGVEMTDAGAILLEHA